MSNGYLGDSRVILKFNATAETGNLNVGAIDVLTLLKAMGMDDSILRTEKFRC